MLDSIGFYGPVILAITNIYYLFYRKTYLYAYILFLIINSFINRILKEIIREPRPNNQRFMKFESKDDIYGMPSGHAQSIFYSTTFLYLTTASYYLLIISLFVCALTIYQRYQQLALCLQHLEHGFMWLVLETRVALMLSTSTAFRQEQPATMETQ